MSCCALSILVSRTKDSAMLNTKNILLNQLSEDEHRVLTPRMEPVELKQNEVLFEPHEEIQHVYFFEGGLSSEIAMNADGSRIEVGCIGREGVSGVPVILGAGRTPHKSFMQAGASALRIRAPDLHLAMNESPALTSILLRYAHVFMIQLAATALADGRYKVDERLARWLLMSHDRLGDELPLTHDFLALMLGVRRPTVTDALHVLEGEQLIRANRGLISIRDRRKLELMAGDAYGVPEAEYRRLIYDSWPNVSGS
jgi:CRP-like cAMP-binding protein